MTFGAAPPPWGDGDEGWTIPMGLHTNNMTFGVRPNKEITCSVSAEYTVMNLTKGD